MASNKVIKELQDLILRMNTYRNAYYNENTSIISDKEYDKLFDRLCELEQETGLVYSNSPTQNVGYTVVSKLAKVKHNHPLLSLAKTTEIDEFTSYFDGYEPFIMAKLDGLTCSLLYQDGELIRAESRGNGEIGEDITHNALMFSNLPKHISVNGTVVVDGECIIDRKTFDEINERSQVKFKNPRNLVSGTVRQLDSSVVADRNVKFFAWKLHEAGYYIPATYNERFRLMEDLGFETAPHLLMYRDSPQIAMKTCIAHITEYCESTFIPIDGIVGAFNDVKYGLSLGTTRHHPKHSLAFKFYQEDNKTTLLDIEWNTSRTGQINPVAIVEPVEIDGTTVSRASLSNLSIIKELELGLGDEVTIIKSNQIIPMITGNLTRSGSYEPPEVCPSCGKPVEIQAENDRESLYCTNKSCPAIMLDKLVNFCCRDGMDIAGLSKERLSDLMSLGYVSSPSDIFKLARHRDELVKLPGYGERSVDMLLEAIEKSSVCKFENFLVAMGIPNVGKSTAKAIAQEVAIMQRIDEEYRLVAPGATTDNECMNPVTRFVTACLNLRSWNTLPDIGEATSNKINEYVLDNWTEFDAVGRFITTELPKINSCVAGSSYTFCITGKLEEFKNRDELVAAIEAIGSKVVSGVTSKTDYLICNDKTSGSSKIKKAAQCGTQIITEKEFLKKFINNDNNLLTNPN